MKTLKTVVFLLFPVHLVVSAFAFSSSLTNQTKRLSVEMSAEGTMKEESCHPFNSLPGDPSLHLVTNVDLGDKKMDIMKACSKVICKATGKPESFIAVCVTDRQNLLFGGSDAPTALGTLYSIGAIGKESNGKITSDITDLLEPFGVAENRIYINFFDMPRANVGWSRRTFAG